jgi:hypothetical protein
LQTDCMHMVGVSRVADRLHAHGRGSNMRPSLVPHVPIPFLDPPPVHWWQLIVFACMRLEYTAAAHHHAPTEAQVAHAHGYTK